MASFYLAPCLKTLRAEVDEAHPDRDRTSDGWVGDTSHAARLSDHNPDYADGGVVRAIDMDKDGMNASRLVTAALNDVRTNYVIYAGYIWSRAYGFAKRVYTGTNKHHGHVHISIRHGRSYENDTRPWGYTASGSTSAPTTTPEEDEPMLTSVAPGKTATISVPKAPTGKKVYVRFGVDEANGGTNIRVAAGWDKDKWAAVGELNKVDGFTGFVFNGLANEQELGAAVQVLSVKHLGSRNPLSVLLQIR